MSHIHDGPLATYNSLTDPNLAGFFGNTRMRRHLRSSGLVNRRGEIVSENQYRLTMARKEHKRHVKDLLAQAIVHKTLDLERYRQVEIKKKLEEIAKIEMVRRVRSDRTKKQDDCLMPLIKPKPSRRKPINRSVVPRKTRQTLIDLERPEMKDNLRPASITQNTVTRGRKGDEEVLPYLTPRSMSRPQSGRPSVASNGRRRPKSAPAPPRERHHSNKSGYTDPYDDVIYVDEEGRPVSPPPPSDRQSYKESLREVRTDNIDTRHLYALDSEALQQYALKLSKSERGRDGASSPYLISQIPQPPKLTRARSARSSPRRSARMSSRPQSSKKPGVRNDSGERSKKDPSTVEGPDEGSHSEGALMLHRQEPAMMHQGEVQTLCEITMKYHGPNLTLPRDQFDPTQEVSIEQQHCGGNTLPVFKERLQAGSTFSFISRRHRGYPFSLTLYIDGRVDCRISTCCEYKHAVGVKLGGKMGHFSLTGITGATPCYKCKLSCQAPPRSLKLKKGNGRGKKKPQTTEEEVTVEGTPRTPITQKTKEEPEVAGKSDDDNYDDDFEEDDAKGIPLKVDIKDSSDVKLLRQVKDLGKRVVLEVEENSLDNISATVDYKPDCDDNVVHLKQLQQTVVPALSDLEEDAVGEEAETADYESESLPKIESTENSSAMDDGLISADHYPDEIRTRPRLKKQSAIVSSPSVSETEDRYPRPKSRLRRSHTEIRTRPDYLSDGSLTSRSVSSVGRSRDSTYSLGGNVSAPEWTSNTYGKRRPKTAWRSEDGGLSENSRRLRPVSARRSMSMRDREDIQWMRAKFYPPIHDCVSHNRNNNSYKDYQMKKTTPRRQNVRPVTSARDRDININIQSLPDGLQNSRITSARKSDSRDVRVKKKEGKINIKIPPSDIGCDTTDDISDSELDPMPRPIKVNIKFNMKGKKDEEVKKSAPKSPTRKREKPLLQQILDEPLNPGVSEAFARHVLKMPIPEKTKKNKANSKTRGRSSSRKGGRGRSPSPKQNPLKKSLNKAKKEIDAKVDDGKGQLEKLLQECIATFGERLKEQQLQFAAQLEEAHNQFASNLGEAQTALSAHGDTVKGDLSNKLTEATDTISNQLENSQSVLKENLQMSQKALTEHLDESQKILGNQLKESQTSFGELVKDSQNVMAEQLKESQLLFSDQVHDSQKLLSDQLAESQNTLTNQMNDAQVMLTNQLKESQVMIADQVKESQQMIADQLKDSQVSMAEQLKTAKDIFTQHFEDSKTQLSDQLATSKQIIAEDLVNSQSVLAKQLDDNQKTLTEQLDASCNKIDQQLHETKTKISEQLEDSQKKIDNSLTETLDKIDQQEQGARDRLQQDSEETQKNIQKQEEEARLRMQQESEESQRLLKEQEENAREKLKQESDDTQKRLAEQEAQAKLEMEKERAETQRRLEEQESSAREKMQKESEETQKRIAEQEAMAKEKLIKEGEETQKRLAEQSEESQKMLAQQSEDSQKKLLEQSEETSKKIAEQSEESQKKLAEQSEETQKKLAEQEQKAKEDMERDRLETAKRLAVQEAFAKEAMRKEGEETAKRLKEQEEQSKEQMRLESEETARRLAEQEAEARKKLQEDSEATQKRLVEQEEKTREMMQKETEESAKRLAEQEAAAKENLIKEGEDSAKRLAEQEKVAREEMQKEADETARKLAEQEALAKKGLQKELKQSQSQISDAMRVVETAKEQAVAAAVKTVSDKNQNYLDQRDGLPSPKAVKPKAEVLTPRSARASSSVKEYTYRMPEVVYMRNDQKMDLIEIPRKVVDDDMMYFCNQDDVEEDESCESLFEGFDGDVTKYSNIDSGLDQTHSDIVFEREANDVGEKKAVDENMRVFVYERGRDNDVSVSKSADECRKVGEKMDRLKLKLERKITSFPLNDSGTEDQGMTEAYSNEASGGQAEVNKTQVLQSES